MAAMSQEEGVPKNSEKLVMIVDDDENTRELLEFVVKKEGFRAATAKDGEDGLNKVQALRPDVILLDLMMPRYGGFEVLRRLQSGESARIPIVIITGRCTDKSTAEMIRQESNVVDFMQKPIDPAVLTMALHRILKTCPRDSGGRAASGG
jgi:two-component system alkaline phosphatase synthesis response regulator PhoP